jgi:hypothetical protein
MDLAVRVRLAVVGGALLPILACGGGARGRAVAAAGPPPEVVKPLQVPASPYYLIYTAPVSLAKQLDTTAHARKPAKAAH